MQEVTEAGMEMDLCSEKKKKGEIKVQENM